MPALIKDPNSFGEYLSKICFPGSTTTTNLSTTTPSAVNELCKQILEKDRDLQNNQDDVDKAIPSSDVQEYNTLCKSETEDWGLTRGKW